MVAQKARETSAGPAASLLQEIRHVNLLYVNAANKILSGFDLTIFQAQVLLFLYQKPKGQAETYELRQLAQTSSSTVCGILKSLRRKGYVDYRHSEDDMRAKQVHLTDKAFRIRDELCRKMEDFEARILQGIPEEDCKKAHETLKLLHEHLTHIAKENRYL